MGIINEDKLKEGLYKALDIGLLQAEFMKLKEGGMTFGEYCKFAEIVVAKAEALSKQVGDIAGEEKLNAVVKFLDDVVELPKILEWADGPLLKALVKQAVSSLNKKFGQDWPEKL